MDGITSYNQGLYPQWNLGAGRSAYYKSDTESATVSYEKNKEISLTTQDGDKVTISASQEGLLSYSRSNEITYEKYSFADNSQGQGTSLFTGEEFIMKQQEKVEFEYMSDLSITVEGDLNEQELKDIKTALRQIDKIMTNMLYGGGDSNEISSSLSKLDNLESISGVEADYRYEMNVIIERSSLDYAAIDAMYRAPDDIPLATDETAMLNNKIDELIKVIEDSGVDSDKFKGPLKNLFSNYADKAGEGGNENSSIMRLIKFIENGLLNRIKSHF